jgi:hypothetical protein
VKAVAAVVIHRVGSELFIEVEMVPLFEEIDVLLGEERRPVDDLGPGRFSFVSRDHRDLVPPGIYG